ncbi:unnamed protein product [Hymenolepis diminuta]|uniref:ER lumen protein-retaining receptor n=1 Tax=Hymenolepis diminuta TaxID=6216 RepID=A0A564Y727_HYMDI|nr:unnamed protein product [Hymenolepis diminuta]
MNIFRLLGDVSHFIAIILLLLKIWKTRSCAGISGKSQLAFAIVFSARYLDIFMYFVSLYNTIAKVVFIASSYATLYLMYFKFKATYDRNHDTFRLEFLVIPSAVLALIFNYHFSLFEASHVIFLLFVPRFCGRSPSTSNRLQFCRNCS